MCESFSHGTNWALFIRTVISWVFTVFISGSFAALFFSAGGYAPSIVQARQTDLYESYAKNLATLNWILLNLTNQNTKGTFNQSLNQTIYTQLAIINALYGYVAPQTYGQLMNESQLSLLTHSLVSPGFDVTNPIYGSNNNVSNVTLLARRP
jgi:hypothetical protein